MSVDEATLADSTLAARSPTEISACPSSKGSYTSIADF
jgi:hypothetical protein